MNTSRSKATNSGQWRRPWWLAFLDKTNVTVTGLTAIFILYTLSVGAAYFAAGATVCSITVKMIKRAIRQPRPAHLSEAQRKLSYGMPSTHSATIMFYATYVPLACANLPLHQSLSPAIRVLGPLVVVPWSTLIAVSRVWLGHHTWAQVGAGSVYGVVFAGIWFYLWTAGLDRHGQVVEEALTDYLGWTWK